MLTLEQVLSKSTSRLIGLNQAVKLMAETLIKRAYAADVAIVITQGFRSIQEQNNLYAQGRTQEQLNRVGLSSVMARPNEPRVTNAKGGTSNHNYGLAIDFAVLSNDGKEVYWTVDAKWMKVVAIAKQLGFTWGGDWTNFKDYPHFEMTFGLSIKQLQAGQRPTQSQMDDIISKINGEDDDKLLLSKYQRDALVTTLTDLNNKGLFTDQNWIKRAQDGSLTVSELAWLNTMIIARK